MVIVPASSACFMSTMNVDSPSVLFSTSSSGVVRASSSIRSECCSARGPDLLAVHAVAAVDALGHRLDVRRIRAHRRLRHAEGLEAELTRGDRRQVALLLRLGAVAQDRPHRVHLRVAGGRVAAGSVDLLEDDARRRQAEPGAAVLLRDQRGEPAVLGQCGDELLRIAVGLEAAPVLAREARAELAHGRADLVQLVGYGEVHQSRA